MWKYILAASGLFLVLACQPVQPSGHAHGGSSHSHGAEDDHQHGDEATVSYTRWTDQVELFVQLKPLVVGELSRFATHFTRLSDYKPFKEGSVTVSLIIGDKGIRHSVEQPSSAGLFTPALQPKTAGKGQLIFELNASGIKEQIIIEGVQVFSSSEEAVTVLAAEELPGETIDFLKEQAWKIDFQVQPVQMGQLAEVIKTTGEILPMHGDDQIIAAPSSGLVVFAKQKMIPGSVVKKGALLFTLVATGDPADNLESKVEEAKATLKQTEVEYLRRKALQENQAISQKDFEASELNYNLAKVSLENLNKYLSEGGRKVFASRGGYIKNVDVPPGDFVETGASVLTITQNRKLQLIADLPQQHFGKLRQIKTADFRTLYNTELQSITQYNGRLISYAQHVSTAKPFIPIYFELDNKGDLLPGSYVELFLHTGASKAAMTIPRTALIEEYGKYYVMVQLSGESFEKRALNIGFDNGLLVEVMEGLNEGEMIVSQGAYQVKMASMASSIPAHGHTH